ncbi:MAG: hypothetical protein NTW86_32360, partial [Candidatus Sumerlaeota bacterium]|nr:hypothetical protein [Candidatus Sumerlaeota bacterium]
MKRPILYRCVVALAIAHVLAPAPHPAADRSTGSRESAAGGGSAVSPNPGVLPEGQESQKATELFTSAVGLYEKADFAGAALYLERALRLDPKNPQIQRALEQTRAKVEERKAALKSVPAAQLERQQWLEARYAEGERYVRQGEMEKAYAPLYQVWLVAGGYREVTQKLKQVAAARAGAQSSGASPNATPVSWVVPKESTPAAAPIRIEPLAAPAPAAPTPDPEAQLAGQLDSTLREAQAEFAQQKYDEAASLYKQALELRPGHSEARRGLDDVAKAKQEQARAAQAAAAPSAEGSFQGQALQQRILALAAEAESRLSAGELDLAREKFEGILKLDPESAGARDGLARVERTRSESDAAKAPGQGSNGWTAAPPAQPLATPLPSVVAAALTAAAVSAKDSQATGADDAQQTAAAEALQAAAGYSQRGLYELAANEYKRALAMDPRNPAAIDGLARAEESQRKDQADAADTVRAYEEGARRQQEVRAKRVG